MNDWDDAHWFKSTDSNDVGCVEVAFLGGRIGVRDTKDGGAGPVLAFDSHEWACFLAGAKRGEFDLPQH
jgi:hypothetical protein